MYRLKVNPEDFVVEELIDLPIGEGNYHYYRLHKRQLSTEQALGEIAHRLNVPRRKIGYAGNKDKHATTVQYISIAGREVSNLEQGGWSLDHVGTGARPISLGMNRGNAFIIIVRDCTNEPTSKTEFINYFGEQRFGEINIAVGRHLIKKEFDKAACILEQQRYIGPGSEHIRRINNVPKRLLKLFIHAYQSYLWNLVAQRCVHDDIPITDIPLVGFATDFQNQTVQKHYEELLHNEDITLRDFIIRQIPDLSSEGATRPLRCQAGRPAVEKLSKNTYRFTFELGSGQYATEYLRQSILHTSEAPSMPSEYFCELSQ